MRFVDVVHAVLSVVVFISVAMRDKNVSSCLYPVPEHETQEVLAILPPICSWLACRVKADRDQRHRVAESGQRQRPPRHRVAESGQRQRPPRHRVAESGQRQRPAAPSSQTEISSIQFEFAASESFVPCFFPNGHS
ncbi:hypothetical protein OIU84_023190 [Salix udensis]|uniref:Secreted protein n=1 Tax=Salix udensis TaxID=889485 RepID=A0AAD6PFB2_9ROSI|nr:hypothetical protein OIU84_023190 [Salix udensis]